MEVFINCGCNGKRYKYNSTVEMRHFKTEEHQTWIRQDGDHLYEQITIDCPCGGSFGLFTQLKHLKSPEHQIWQAVGDNKNQMPFICQCSFIVPYGKLAEHRASNIHVIPKFDFTRKTPWKLS